MIWPFGLISLSACEISEPYANGLRIVALRLSAQGTTQSVEGISGIPLLPDQRQKAIEIIWPTYILYTVLNESYAMHRPELPGASANLEVIEDPVIEHVIAKQTFATHDFPGPYKHWVFRSENHLALVTSLDAPVVTEVETEQRWLDFPGPRSFVAS